MAVNRVPVLKRCRSLGMDPVYLGIDKKSNRQLKRSNRKMSEYGLQLREKQKAKFIYGVLEKPFLNLFVINDLSCFTSCSCKSKTEYYVIQS